MKVAHFSPLPPQRSGIADYCHELLPKLAQHMRVDVFSTTKPDVPDAYPFAVRSISEFWHTPGARYHYDLCLYHMGNHPAYHASIYDTLIRYPGITVLHDLDLHAFFLQRAANDSVRSAYVREMGYDGGSEASFEAVRLLSRSDDPPATPRPLIKRVVDNSLGLIVHTEQARNLIRSTSPDAAVLRVPLATTAPDSDFRPERPALLDPIPSDVIILASLGHIAANKRIDVILRALAQLRHEVPRFHYLLIGPPVSGYDPGPLISELGLNDIVHRTDFVEDRVFQVLLNWIDIGLNLRTTPTGGEMSATLVRLLAHGRPVLVSDVGGFSEFPDNVVLKIVQDEDEITQLRTALRHLITDTDARHDFGQAARAFAKTHLSFSAIARQYASFIEDRLGSLLSPG